MLRELLLAECSLKAKRHLAVGLQEHGFDLDSPLLGARLSLELSRGAGFVTVLRSRLMPAELAYLFSDRAFGVQRPALMGRLPYLLAHGYHMVELLARLGDPTRAPAQERCFAGAVFNLACVLLDHITDRMHAAGEIERLLPRQALLTLCLDGGDTTALAPITDRDPVDELNVFGRVLALFVTPAFGDGDRDGDKETQEPRIREMAQLLARGYAAQLSTAVRGASSEPEVVRTKSVTPHLLLGHLAALDVDEQARATILQLASLTGELFGLLDDLIDVGEDALAGHANSVTGCSRSPGATVEQSLLTTLDGPALPEAASRLLQTIVQLVEQTPRERNPDVAPNIAGEWLQFIFAYIARAYR